MPLKRVKLDSQKVIPDKNPIPGNKKFGIDQPQPSPEAKKRGWVRRKEAQRLMNCAQKYLDMTYAEVRRIKRDMKTNPQKYTVREVKMIEYITKNKYLLDFIDRHVSKAPVNLGKIKIESDPLRVILEKIDKSINEKK